MAIDQSALLELLEVIKAADVSDRIRTATETMYQALLDAELTAVIGAGPWERADGRVAQRNGSRPRTLTTPAGDLELRIPKLRSGTFFPSLLERRRRVDQALFAAIMQAYVEGVSTRKVGDLVKALGAGSGISKSEVSRICADLDAEVGEFRDRFLAETTFRMCSLMPPIAKPGWAVALCLRLSSSRSEYVLTGDGKSSASMSVTARTVPSPTAFLRSLKARGLAWGEAGHLRCTRRLEERDQFGVDRGELATVPSAGVMLFSV